MILAIDDDDKLLKALGKILKGQVIMCERLESGLHIARTHQPPVILLDVYLGDVCTVESIPELLAATGGEVIMLATATTYRTRARAYELGAFDFLSKIDLLDVPQVVEAALSAMLRRRRGRDSRRIVLH